MYVLDNTGLITAILIGVGESVKLIDFQSRKSYVTQNCQGIY